jgi:hypothetical protein
VYKTLWDLLDADYDVEPTKQTQDLIAEIKAALPFSGASATGGMPIEPPGVPAGDKPEAMSPKAGPSSGLNVDPLLAAREARLILVGWTVRIVRHRSKARLSGSRFPA